MAELRKNPIQLRTELSGGTLNGVTIEIADPKKLRVKARLSYRTRNGEVDESSYIANSAGKVKVYSDIDSVLKEVMSVVPTAASINIETIDTTTLIRTPSSNPVSNAKSELKKIVTSLASLAGAKTKANQQVNNLQTYQNGTPSQQAQYQEAVAQVTSITEAETAATTRKSELETFIAANGG